MQVYIVGINEKDIEIEVGRDFLKINVLQEFESDIKNVKCIGEEWESSSFNGVVSLPCKVVPMLIHHFYDGQVLEVRLKKVGKS